MYSIASLLDPASSETVRALWARFELRCGLTGIKTTPLPHFSYMGTDSFLFVPVEEALLTLSKETQPFTVRTTGLGIFTGAAPVVYISVVKNAALLNLHERVWDLIRPYAVVPNIYYQPDRWMPHITLAYREIDPERLGCAIEDMAFQRMEIEVLVDHLALIFLNMNVGQGGVRKLFPFQRIKK